MHKQRSLVFFICLAILGMGLGIFYYNSDIKISYNLFVETEDEVLIAFDVYEPKLNDTLDKKAVILGHGIAVNKEFLHLMARELAMNGFVAVTFDFRGHGRSTGQFNPIREFTSEDYHDPLLNDIQAIKNYLDERNDIDMNNLGYLGYSMGGGVGFELCTQDPDFKAMVGLAPEPDYMNTNTTHPNNLLLITGKFDEAIDFDQLMLVMENKTGLPAEDIELNQIYNENNFSEGLASKIYVDSNADHLTIPYDTDAILETRNWFMQSLLEVNPTQELSLNYPGIIANLLIIFTCGSIVILIAIEQILQQTSKLYPEREPLYSESFYEKISIKQVAKEYFIFVPIVSIPSMLLTLPVFLTPFMFSNLFTSLICGISLSVYFFNKKFLKKNGFSIKETYSKFRANTTALHIMEGICFGLVVYALALYSIGNIVGIMPANIELIWSPIFIALIFFSIYNFNAFYLPVIADKIRYNSKTNMAKSILTYFLLQFGVITILILIPCLIIWNFFLAIALIIGAPLFLIIAAVSVMCYAQTKDIFIPTLSITFVLSLIFLTLSPVLPIF